MNSNTNLELSEYLFQKFNIFSSRFPIGSMTLSVAWNRRLGHTTLRVSSLKFLTGSASCMIQINKNVGFGANFLMTMQRKLLRFYSTDQTWFFPVSHLGCTTLLASNYTSGQKTIDWYLGGHQDDAPKIQKQNLAALLMFVLVPVSYHGFICSSIFWNKQYSALRMTTHNYSSSSSKKQCFFI